MKIGFEAKRVFTNTTGLGLYCRTLISSLATMYSEHEYYLFTPKLGNLFDTTMYPNMQVVLPEMFIDKLITAYWRSSNVKKDIVSKGIGIYHGLSHEIPYNIHKLKNVKTVVTMHDLIIERYPELFNPVDVKIYRFKYKYACRHADKIIAVSKQTKQDLIDFYKVPDEKIEVCYPSTMKFFDRKVTETEKQQIKALYKLPDKFFLSVGSIIPRKNLLTVCKAYNELKNTIDIPIIVIGKGGKYKEEVKQYIAANNLNNRIIFLNDEPHVQSLQGFKSGEDFPAIYQQALCMIYPSIFEGFGLPVLEALQSGLPVITSNVSCLPETGGDAAYYVDPLSVKEMAKALEAIATNEQLRKEMIAKGYQHAAFFSQERRAERVMELYQSMMR
jgi:glycosyltransferase involved in cell wall biosynthesis